MPTATEIISEASTLLMDPSNSHHTIANMRTYLNRALKDICNRAKCIRETMYIAAVADQWQYGLPLSFLQADAVAFNGERSPVAGGSSHGQWYPLTRAHLKGILNERYTLRSQSQPDFYDQWGNSRVQRVSGTATGGGSTSLIDTGSTFNGGATRVFEGDLAINTTDGSEATVTGLTGANQVDFSDGLAGGSDNTFASGDSYVIVSPHAPHKTLIIHPAPSTTDTTGTESIALYFARKHRVITQEMMDENRDWLELDEELEMALIRRTMQYAQEEEYGVDSSEAVAQFTHYQTEYAQNIVHVRRRIREFKSLWLGMLGGRRVPRIIGTTRDENPFNTTIIG